MGSFLTEMKGFTPIIDALVKELGLMPAAVYGVAWRYCQMETGLCQASHETIGEHLGLTRQTVHKYIKQLCDKGYLEDTTPSLRNHPHTYRDTGSVIIQGLVNAKSGVKEVYTEAPGVKEIDSGCKGALQQGVKELYTKREGDSIKEEDVARSMFSALAEICKIDLELITKEMRGKLNQTEKMFRGKGIAPADVASFGQWWTKHDWRGQKGAPPTPAQVRETWGQYTAQRDKSDVIRVGR